MAEELQHEEMSQGLKTEQERHPSPRQAVLSDQWDSVESDTESLAQERAYQQQLHMRLGRHDQNKNILHQMEKADSLEQKGREEGDANYDETEDLQVYDSLDIAAHPNAYLDTLIDERRGTSELLTDDAYSDLRYDPNWRTNLRGAGRCNEITQISAVEYYQVPQAKCGQSCGDRRGLVIKGEYRYIADTSPAVGLTSPYMEGNESSRPYRLHLQDDQTSSVTSPHCHNKPTSPEADYSKPSYIFTKNESDKSSVKGVRKKPENSCDNAGENISRCPEWIKDKDNMFIQDFKTCQELRHTQGGPTQMQQMSTSTFPKVLLNKKLAKLPEDIVERNKVTLGRNTSKCGSYVSVYALKQEMPHNVNKVHGSLKEKSSADSQEDSADPELKTQQLRVTQISKGKKAQRKEYPNRPQQQQQQPPALGVKAEWTDCLSSPLERPAAVTQPNPQKSTSLQPLLSAFHLNLNTSSHLLPFIQHRGQDDVKNLASLHGCPASEVELTLSPECQQTIPGKSSQMSWKGVNTYLHPQNLQCCPEQWQRTTAFKWPLSREGEDHKCHAKPFLQSLPRTPSTTLSVGSSSSTVLPPIGKSTTGLEPELSPGVDTADSIHRSSSDGYLVQMEKQKQLMARVTYKAYSLKDYKQLKSDINLRGLGPDYTAIEKTKMKRQKLYSNVIREQNKKISRIPFLLAKDPEGNTKKVPRMKALEYAKTIAKPSVQSQPKQRQKHQSESFTEHAPYLKGMDVSQLATLEILRKRHEEEKQAVALFRKVHAV